MITKETIIELWGSAFKAKHATFDKRFVHPVRDWLIGLSLFLGIVVAGGTYSAVQFVAYRNIGIVSSSQDTEGVRYNKVLVDNMITQYRARKEAYSLGQQEQVTPTFETVVPLQTPVVEEVATSTEVRVEEELPVEDINTETETETEGGALMVI